MILYALKSDEGYLKILENNEFLLVGINKASVYPKSNLEQLRMTKEDLKKEMNSLRIVQMTLEEKDFFE